MSNNANHLDLIFEALGNKHRREIILSLSRQPASISQLADERKLSLPAIHKHIRQLEEAELIQRKKLGRTNFLALNRVGLLAAQNWLGEFHAYWGSDRESLDNYLSHLNK